MNRNLDFRSEVAVPVYDADLQSQLMKYVTIQFTDNTKARIHSKDKLNEYQRRNGRSFKAQDEIFKWILSMRSQSQLASLPQKVNVKSVKVRK